MAYAFALANDVLENTISIPSISMPLTICIGCVCLQVAVRGARGIACGFADVSIDGQHVDTFNACHEYSQPCITFRSRQLPPGRHRIVLTNTGRCAEGGQGSYMTIAGFMVMNEARQCT